MIRAKLETRHFTFEAYGNDEAEAYTALQEGWDHMHRKQYPGAEAFDDFVQPGDVNFYPVEVGRAYRDGEELK